ncbi:hypothetical protein Aperf_G00000069925 [Anoplocephala perfoliata]
MAMLERYSKLSIPERKLWDLKEDRILATVLHNLIVFMIMLKSPKQEIYNAGYHFLGRCRLGSYFSHSISHFLECVAELSGNAVDLTPSISDSIYREAFIVTIADPHPNPGNDVILEIYNASFLLRTLRGAIESMRHLANILAILMFQKAKACVILEAIGDHVNATLIYCKKAYSSEKTFFKRSLSVFSYYRAWIFFSSPEGHVCGL